MRCSLKSFHSVFEPVPSKCLAAAERLPRRAGVTGGVTAMPDFLAKFFPDIAAAQQAGPVPSAARQVQYCLFDDQGLQLFTSSLYLAGTASTLAGSYTSRCGVVRN